ncbi:glycoside hydrolase family 5 protein [Gilvimarinus agarilyticus]|uniref:cellulase family glycosylhydrolase n=1 Tax=Reichenbachiella sp. MSK19-1 TaxID=1897631 RepID=UPI000EBFB394|nr:cellulase family glycosylhydrolase [Reichenbachiella sp. MSK19-1]MBU2884735.1 glycoside hydrolase family 5 protein [Gilvimarinus agarilyticus]RJE70372.1 hypothetical protein BGP76_09770 [Reichenbachiella sp. MSK19-1]
MSNMKRWRKTLLTGLVMVSMVLLQGCPGGGLIDSYRLISGDIKQYEKAEFEIIVNTQYVNAYDQDEVMLDMILTTPLGEDLILPCYFERNSGEQQSLWKARFAAAEVGSYSYYFKLTQADVSLSSAKSTFEVSGSSSDGFLHVNDFWTLKFDSGKPFRGIGENVGWESRNYENPKHTYDYLLPTLSENGANFFRTWMCAWDLPIEWPKVSKHTDRYTDSDAYFHPQGIQRMDELVDMIDSLDLYMMLAMNTHGPLIDGGGWENYRYNTANGGPAETPTDFFTNEDARKMSKNKFRFLVARWGYSTHIGAWEFFNEIDNSVFTRTPHDSIRIPHEHVTAWHEEMSNYIKSIDPYGHIVTTSVSHREIDGMFDVKNIDIAQRHIYKKTDQIPALTNQYAEEYGKPFVWGEFGYEWDWNLDFSTIAEESDYDYKRGLWYGLFNPTPILPMTWWWEFFDDRNMTPYFQSVRMISDMMLAAGDGAFKPVAVASKGLEAYSVQCGEKIFVGVLNSQTERLQSDLVMDLRVGSYDIKRFNPDDRSFITNGSIAAGESGLVIPKVSLQSWDEMIYILTPKK